jgi:hypothetical protein
MGLTRTIFGRSKATKPNTFIGEVSATINTPALIAGKLGINESRIKAFKIVGNDIEFAITGGTYKIANNAFNGNTSLTYYKDLNNLVTEIGANAFYHNTSYTGDVVWPSVIIINQTAFTGTNIKSFSFPNLNKTTGGGEFSYNTSLISFSAPLLVSAAGVNQFQENTNLVTLYAPKLILTNSNSGFCSNCINLTDLNIGKPTGIGTNAFLNNGKITAIDLSNATSIGHSAFRSCTLLNNIVNINQVTTLLYDTFLLCSSLGDTISATSLLTMSGNVFAECSNVKRYAFDNLTTISSGLPFNSNSSLLSVYMPKLTQLGPTLGNDSIFNTIKTGATITVSPYLKTVDSGAPDGDLVYASDTRGAIIVYPNVVVAGAYSDLSQKSVNNGLNFSNLGLSGTLARGVCISENTKYITFANNGGVYVSNDFGNTTTAVIQGYQFFGSAMNKTGQYQLACPNGGFLQQSSDYGVTWNAKHIAQSYRGTSISGTGQYQLACGYAVTNLVLSTDFGVTWNNVTSAGLQSWSGARISDNGQYITAVPYNGTIRTSSDFGSTWINKTAYGNFVDGNIAMSSNGQYQTVTGDGKNIYTSNDFGVTFTQNVGSGIFNFSGVSMNGEGNLQAACVSTGFIYISNDYGATWVQSGGSKNYQDIAVSR